MPLSAASHDDAVVANMVLPLDALVDGPLKKKSEPSTFTSKVSTRSRSAARKEDVLKQIWEYIDFEPAARCDIHSQAFGTVLLHSRAWTSMLHGPPFRRERSDGVLPSCSFQSCFDALATSLSDTN